ncbi:hypothetical protein [Anaerovorax odorimutans]|uniref:hypothetical protein n=1 Tax=Anaerovorax odorimutans TaxID=109327 RepID=UPI0004093A85|nr:hypothetical protein [Anaerovorax odorimutans]
MTEKQTRNKFRDIIGDYFKTNRQIAKEESKREGYKGALSNREKSMILVIVILILILIVKSCFLDEVRNLTPKEEQFKDFVEYSISEKYNGSMEKIGIINYRIYDIYVAAENEKTKLNYTDPNTKEKVNVVLNDRYNARVRGYFLWVIPIKHFSVTAPKVT